MLAVLGPSLASSLASSLAHWLAPLLVLAGVAPGLAPTSPSDGIVGGELVEPGSHPAVVAVLAEGLCTGTLLRPDMVITAAHCLENPLLSPEQIAIVVGDAIDGQLVRATAYGVHPDFCDPTRDEGCDPVDVNDYGWIQLAEPVAVDPADIPVVLTDEALHHRALYPGAELELVGFGEDDSGNIGFKRHVFATVTSLSPSGEDLRIGGEGRDSCEGDSGGPALVRLADGRMALVGVLSRGSRECGGGGVYGAPLPALCWVRDDSGIDVAPAGCESCDCVDLTPLATGCGCSTKAGDPLGHPSGWPWWLVVPGLLRRRARRVIRPRSLVAVASRAGQQRPQRSTPPPR